MPYIDKERREILDAGDYRCMTHGDLNYVMSSWIKAQWDNKNAYKTVHEIKKIVENPDFDKGLSELVDKIRSVNFSISRADIDTALGLAFMEFYRCVVSGYEESKKEENGDVWYV